MIIDSHLEIIVLLYIIFAVIAIISTVIKIARSHKLSIMNMCSAMYIVLLAIVPAIIFKGYTNGLRVTSGIDFTEQHIWTFYLQFVLTILGYLFLHFGYRIKTKEGNSYTRYDEQKTLLVSVIFTVLSLASLVLWASGYGGVIGLIAKANQIRAGFVSSTNSFTFFKHFVPLSLMASWMLFNVLIRKGIKGLLRKTGVLILLVCDIALSSIYIQANDGRMLLAVYVFLFFVLYFKYQYEVKQANITPMLIKFGIAFLVAISILFNADAILSIIKNESYESSSNYGIVETLSKEFSFIVSGTQNAMIENSTMSGNFMIINDVVNGVFAWLPTSLKPIILEDVWDYNTRILNTGGYGQSPTSIVAQSIYDLSFLGIIIIPVIYGMLIRKFEKALEKRKGNIFYDTVYVVLGYYLCKGIPYFSFYNIMINTFFIFIAIFIHNTVHKIKLR